MTDKNGDIKTIPFAALVIAAVLFGTVAGLLSCGHCNTRPDVPPAVDMRDVGQENNNGIRVLFWSKMFGAW